MSDEQLRADEVVSAYLDGEATAAEIAEIERNEALLARMEQLRSVRDATAAPVATMGSEERDQMIDAALAAQGAKIVPLHRRHSALLAMAAAVVLLAVVVSAGLIASRGTDNVQTAAEATADMTEVTAESAESADAPAEMAAAAEADADMAAAPEAQATTDMAAVAESAESAAVATTTAPATDSAESEPMSEAGEETAAGMAEEEAAPLAMADTAAQAETAEATDDTAIEAPASEDQPEADVIDTAERAGPAVDLGEFENLESLFSTIAARWPAALEDGTTADSGVCAEAVNERALVLDLETGQPFTATVEDLDRLRLDAQLARRADGAAVIVYAAAPDCVTMIHEPDTPERP